MLKLNGCVVVADALNCQKEIANAIINQGGDYLLCPKDNHKILKKDIEDFVQDPDLNKTMEKFITKEKIEIVSKKGLLLFVTILIG